MTTAIPRLTDQEIRDMALGLAAGTLFTGSEAPPELLSMVFMPLMFGLTVEWDDIGNIVEDISKAGPRSINGYPMFTSCRLVHKDDWKVVCERATRAREAMDAAVGGYDDGR